MLGNKLTIYYCYVVMAFLLCIFYGCKNKTNMAMENESEDFSEEPIDTLAELTKHIVKFDDIGNFKNGVAVISKNGLIGLADKLESICVECKYSNVGYCKMGIWSYSKGSRKYGFINKNGKEITEPIYDDYTDFRHGYALVKRNNLCGVINTNGKEVVPCIYEYLSRGDDADGLFLYKENKLYGWIDTLGNVVVKPQYTYAEDFSEGLALVHIDNDDYWKHAGYIDKKGNVIVDFKYVGGKSFREGYANALVNGNWNRHYVLLDKDGREYHLPKEYDIPNREFHEGLIPVTRDENGRRRWGYIDTHGNIVIDFKYSNAGDFHEGVAKVSYGKGYGYIDKRGNAITSFVYEFGSDHFENGLAKVYNDQYNYGVVDKTGEIVPIGMYEEIGDFHENMASVVNNGKTGFINSKGELVIPCVYDYYEDESFFFSDGLARVRKNGVLGFVDKQGNSTFDKFEE